MLNIILYLYMKYLFFYYMYPYQTIIIFIFVTHQEVIQISYSSSQLIQSVPEPPRICSGYLHPHAAHTNPFSFVTIQLSLTYSLIVSLLYFPFISYFFSTFRTIIYIKFRILILIPINCCIHFSCN